MDRPSTPSRYPEYHLPAYDDHDHNDSTPNGQSSNPAAIRLLTSVEEDHLDNRPEYSGHRRSYQPSIMSDHSRFSDRHSGITDPPSIPPPDSTYVPFQGRGTAGSPPRPWSRMSSDYGRPPPAASIYEPSDINGSPRPGTPSSRYGGSPRRPLPPAPLFSNPGARHSNTTFADDVTVSIPLDNDPDDVFGPETDLGDSRPMRHSYQSQDTLGDGGEPEEAGEKVHQHYGPAPDGKQERRGVRAPQMSRREVQLINGELVLECKIPTILYSFLPRRDEVEFTHMRYTAVTCDPDDFVDRGYKLRQSIGRTARETELFICVTMYNEDEVNFTRTMYAVMKNISHFCSRTKSRTWGELGWQKIVVCIVSDGREKIHPRTLDALAAMGVYQDGIAKNYVNQKAVQAHVYEYTTQVSLDSDLKFKGAEKGIVPCQIIFCLKEKNQRKLNSHRWFFNAFGKALNPNVCILLDVGTRPGTTSLYHLWKAFDTDSNVAGACGEIKAMKGKCLDPDTIVRTAQGPKAIRDIAVGDRLFDHQDNPVQCLAAGAIQTSSHMKKVIYTEWNASNKMSFTCTPDHIMTLVAHSVKPCLHSQGLGVMWYTRCERTELKKEERDSDDIIIDLDAYRNRKLGSITLSSPTRASDATYRQTPEPAPSSPLKASQASSHKSAVVEDDHMGTFQAVRDQLSKRHGNRTCQNPNCKGIRPVSIEFKTREQAKLAHELLAGDQSRIVDPCAVKDMELFTMTMNEYLASCTASTPQENRKLSLYRAPLRFQPYQGPQASVPIDPYWLGFWLGDGMGKNTDIGTTDLELKVYVQAYVDRLNSTRPEGAAPLHVAECLQTAAAGSTTSTHGRTTTGMKDCFIFSIDSATSKPNETWNPVRAGLEDLGLLGDKARGIPDCYMNANEDTRLAVLAGLVESDGWLQARTAVYGFAQTTYQHKKIVEDAHKLATSCGIHCSDVEEYLEPGHREPTWRFYMGKGTEKFQHHLLLPRKRLDLSSLIRHDRDVRAFDVEEAGEGEYRTIEVSGGFYQLADRTVVHNCGKNLLNPLVASQNFEYKMSNILDKPLESVFGYITVLPGALSAYRFHALQNDETGHGPLSQYFKGETLHGQHADVFTANMYLAEDRILCWELVAKRGDRWVLKYVKGCTGETDVPDSVPEFISQRRRWLNGAFFAAVYSLVHFKQIWVTDHTLWRKFLLHVEFFYQFLQVLFTFFSLANFYLTFYFVAGGLADPRIDPFGHGIGQHIFTILRYACALLIATQFILSLGNRPQGASRLYLTSMIIFTVIMIYTSFATVWIVVWQLTRGDADVAMGNNVFTNLIVSVLSTVGLYIVMSLMYLEPWHLITSSAQYFMLLPFSICTLQVYAFCNTHDVTWGTKGDNVMRTDLGGAVGRQGSSTVELEIPSEQLDIDSGYDEALRNLRDRVEVAAPSASEAQMQEDYYRSVRTYVVVSWMIANGILAMAVSEAYSQTGIGENYYLRFILWSVASLALFRALGSTAFAVINVVNMAVEGRMRMRLKTPKWMGGWGDKVSSKVSEKMSSIGSSVGSSLGR
ncbi:hypothetical protein SODALDRAFT_374292 [Sodiomyces alkalinus F11]|uniref:chitin synthase n=1 Tax=Sodiomyces alkalinus (strain CBS 110278 / VKM F-3762 / F11) TaxID=1314773 RepID=A0A3N2Q5I6_SODAK|nr:hypothetical protein SODALDRAFT_374292 [Sodiomyces alkalinus F11]ROT41885.1 hypothetical protein SODALDRAFT_374292 [Sodiomyces alkalinus F11]